MTATHPATAKALANLYKAQEALEVAALAMVRDEVAALSRRYPSRLVTYATGNGARGLQITRRRPIAYGPNHGRKAFNIEPWGLEWTSRHLHGHTVAFFAALDRLEKDSGINWLACDSFTYQNGREVALTLS